MVDYNPSIPQPTDNLSNSQGQMLNNFTQLNNIFDINHFTWNDAVSADRGMHRKVDLPATTVVVAPAGLSSVVYSKTVAGVAGLYFDNAVGSSAVWRGGSGDGLITSTTGGNATSGTMTFPNGIILKWGYVASVADATPINFPVAFPNFCFTVVPSALNNNPAVRSLYVQPGSISKTAFSVRTSSGSMGVTYWAIGN